VLVNPDEYRTISPAGDKMKICAFLWVYYGYPNSNYEGVNVEVMRYRNGAIMARDEAAAGGAAAAPAARAASPCRALHRCGHWVPSRCVRRSDRGGVSSRVRAGGYLAFGRAQGGDD